MKDKSLIILLRFFYIGASNANKVRIWHFKCDCGNECDKPIAQVKIGNIKSCGCLDKQYNQTSIGQKYENFNAIVVMSIIFPAQMLLPDWLNHAGV